MIDFISEHFGVDEEKAVDFLIEYEINTSLNEDYDYGELYKVDIILNEVGIEKGMMKDLEAEGEKDNRVFIKLSEAHAVIFFEIPEDSEDGAYEIEMLYGAFLDGGEYGEYFWKCLI